MRTRPMRGTTLKVAFIVWLVAILMSVPSQARAEQVRVLSSVALKSVLDALAPEFARTSRHTIAAEFGIAAAMKTRIESGEPFDVAILTPAMLEDLAARGLIEAGPRVLARSGLGLMVKAGAAKPDVSTVDAFKRTLLSARVTYVPNSASGVAFLATLDTLGIAEQVKARARIAASADEVNSNVIGGAADVAVLPVSEILPVAGAALGGVFPADVQSFIVMGAGVNGRSSRAAAAREFVAFLMSEKSTPTITAKGMQR